jgi:hypothetical protein
MDTGSQPQLSHSHQAQPNYFGFLTYAIAEVVGFNAQLPKNKRVEIDFIPHSKKLSKKSLSTTRSVLVSLRWFPGIGQGVEAAGCRALRPMRPGVLSKSFRCVEAGARDSTTAQTIHFISLEALLLFALRGGATASAGNAVKGSLTRS